jgi:hypothetical protein
MTGKTAESEGLSERITRRVGRLLGRWGVDPLQYHYLLQCSLTMDFRSTNPLMGRGSETKSALRQTAFLNLLFGGFMSVVLAFHADTFLFATLMLGYAMAMIAMMVLMEFGLVVISPDDHSLLAHRPISSLTFLAVRFSNLVFYVLVLSLSLNGAPCFIGLICRGSTPWFPLVYLLVSTAAAVSVAGAVVVFYGLFMRWFHHERMKDVLVYCQIALSFLFFFGYQLVPRLVGTGDHLGIESLTHGWGVLFPSVWFAGLVELGLGRWSWESVATGGAALLLMAVVMPWLFRAVSLDYSAQVGRMIAPSGNSARVGVPRQTLTDRVARVVCRSVEERAFFCFVVTMLRRNRNVKLQLYPNFGIVIAMLVLTMMDEQRLPDPASGQGISGMVASMTAMAFVFGAAALAGAIPYSDEYAGAWLFQTAPMARPEVILKAIKKAALLFLFAPMFLLTFGISCFLWPVLRAVQIGTGGLLIGITFFQIALLTFRGFPFAKKPEKGVQSGHLVLMMIVAMAGMFILLPILLLGSPTVLAVGGAALLIGNLALASWTNRRFARIAGRGMATE